MEAPDSLSVNFRIDEAAKREISHLRELFKRNTKLNPDVVVVAWAETHFNNGSIHEGVLISFYTVEQRKEIIHGVRIVDGLEVVLFTIPRFFDRFEGKTLSFRDDRFQLTE